MLLSIVSNAFRTLPRGGFTKNALQSYNFSVKLANFSDIFCNFAPKFIKYLR